MDTIKYNQKELPLVPFSELKGKTYVIPFQQRGYKWTSSNVEELLCDLREFIEDANPQNASIVSNRWLLFLWEKTDIQY